MLRLGDRVVLDRLIAHLVSQGYSRRNILIQPSFGQGRPDVLLLDPTTRAPLAVVEVRENLDELEDVAIAGDAVLNDFGTQNADVRIFLAQPQGETFGFLEVISKRGDKAWYTFSTTSLSEFPRAPSVVRGARASALAATLGERRRAVDGFKATCWLLAAAAFLVGAADTVGLIDLNPTRLAIFGVVIALVVIPFASRLKLLGVEFERLQKIEEHDAPDFSDGSSKP